jgi:phage terminase large subunit-like protein
MVQHHPRVIHDEGERCIQFIQRLKLNEGEFTGKRIVLIPWQKSFIRQLFRTDPEGKLIARWGFLGIPRKAGKSCLIAGIALYFLLGRGKKGIKICSVACDIPQASLCFNFAADMIRQDKYLSSICQIRKSQRKIFIPHLNSLYEVKSGDADAKDGYGYSLIIADELHAWKNPHLYEVLRSGQKAQAEPMTIVLTTAGQNPYCLCKQLWDRARDLQSAKLHDPTCVAVVYEASADDDPFAPATWLKCHPSIGHTVPLANIQAEANEAKQLPSLQAEFKRTVLNLWCSEDTKWLPYESWKKCSLIPFDPTTLKGRKCFGGLDLSTTTDLSAFALAFPLDAGGMAILVKHWMPSANVLKAERRDGLPYGDWIAQGHITATPGNVIDYQFIRDEINSLKAAYGFDAIACDPWNCTQLGIQLASDGFTLSSFRQGFISFNEPSKYFERLVISEKLVTLGNPVLDSQAHAVVVLTDPAGNIKPSKLHKGTQRIDGIVASIMAVGLAMKAQPDDTPSIILI